MEATFKKISPITEDGVPVSDELKVFPLQKNEVAVYKLLAAEQDDFLITDLNNKARKRRPGFSFAGKQDIYDPIRGETVTILNKSKGKRKVQTTFGEISTTGSPESVKFTSDTPVIVVKHDQPETYAFMERMNENKSNKYARKGVVPVFERVDHRKRAAEQLEKSEFKLDAMNWVMKEAKYPELVACAEKVQTYRPDVRIKTDYKNSEASTGFELLKRELFALAEDDPHTIIKSSNKVDSIMKMQIRDAERFQVILFSEAKKNKVSENDRVWFHNEEQLKRICTVELGKNPHEALFEHFEKTKDGHADYTKMVTRLSRILTPQ